MLKSKKLLWLSSGVALLGVFVASIATAAWFQIDSQPLQTSLVSSSPNITIDNDNIYGYKIKQNIGSNGFIDYDADTVAKIHGSQIAGTNIHQDDEDINFDVPSGGIGYYIIKQNPGGTYKYTYNSTAYSWKFSEYSGSSRSYTNSISLSAGDNLIVKKYTFEANKTVNKQVDINSTYGADSSTESNSIVIGTAGTYKAWFDSANGTIGFEDVGTPISGKNLRSHHNIKRTISIESGKMYFICPTSVFSGWGSVTNYVARFNTGDVNMTYDSNNASYYCEIPSAATGVYFRFKEGNVQWQADGGSKGSSVAYSISYSTGKILTVSSVGYLENWDSTNKHAKLTAALSTEINNSTTKTVYLYDPNATLSSKDGSVLPYAYAFKNDTYVDENASWPGKAMTRIRDYYYSINVPTSLTSIIFTNSAGSIQTANLTTPTGTSCAYDYSASTWYNPAATTATTYTYYLYDPDNYYEGAGYVKYWSNKYNISGTGPVAMTSTGTTRLFSVTINVYFDHLLFCKTSSYGTQTADLEIPQTNKYYVLTSGTAGSWKNLSTVSGSRTIRLYDPNGWLGATPKIYAFETSVSHYPTKNADWPGVAMTQSNTRADGHLYTITIPTTYTKIMFANSDGSVQTADGGMTPDGSKYYVLTSKSNNIVSGHWYTALASEDTYTYYFYDNRVSGRWTAPYAYAWASSGVTNDADNYSIYPYQAAAWPGIAMTQATAKATADGIEPEYTWSITVSQSYDKIIFNKGVGASSSTPGDQTNDLTTTGHNGQYCILNGQTDGKWNVQWNNNIYGITLKASYFIGGAQSSFDPTDLGSENSVGLVNYTPKLSPVTNITKADAANGIVYYFSRVGTTWYTDPDCAAGHAYSAGPLTGSITLYAKYNVDVSNYKDIYIDTVNTGWGDSVYIFNGGGTEKYFGGYKVAPNLYRVTLPSSWNFRVSKNDHVTGDTNGNWWSVQITVNSYTTGTYGVVTANGDSNQNFSVKSLKTTSYGTAKIQKYNGSSWVDISGGTMEIGDGTSNYFVFEHGLQIPVNTKIRVVVTNGSPSSLTGTYDYSKYLIPDGTTTPYVVNDGGDIKTANYTGNARFNFYITSEATPKLTIAMVPDLGNGYYIMDYNSTYGTNNFISETKMSSSNKTRAVYDGYYATAGKQVFIKSYLDAVDVLYTTLSASSSAYASISNGVITITSAGYYSITVDNGTITISSYSIDDDFKLNKLDISKNTSKELIWKQKTSIVLEIPFTCDNKYASTISINPDFGNLSHFVGASLYVTDAAHKLADPYTTLRGSNSSTRSTYYNSLSNAATITDSNSFVIPANSGSTVFYAYILIDYLPTGTGVSYTNFTNSTYLAGQIWFYIKDTQQ